MLSKILWSIGTIAVTLIITGSQKYLSTRKVWQLGAIVPILSLVVMAVLYFSMKLALTAEFIVPCAIIIALEFFIWLDGRHQYHKSELNRMKAKDIE